jgi:hypothetical protein
MFDSVALNNATNAYTNFLMGAEQEGKQISQKQVRDILDNGWLGAQMKNVNDMLQKSKGQ